MAKNVVRDLMPNNEDAELDALIKKWVAKEGTPEKIAARKARVQETVEEVRQSSRINRELLQRQVTV